MMGTNGGRMESMIVETSGGVTLLGGGEASLEDLEESLTVAPVLVAADGGALLALEAGATPDAVIGDMDSLSETARVALPHDRLHRVAEQDTTDFDKVLRSVQAAFFLGVGFLGARLDHQLAALNTLLRHRKKPCLLIGPRDAVFAAPPNIRLDLVPEMRLSLFPMAPVQGTSEGLEWPIDPLDFSPGGIIGTSNRVAAGDGVVRLRFETPGMIVMVPRRAWRDALAGLRQAQRWPDGVRARQ